MEREKILKQFEQEIEKITACTVLDKLAQVQQTGKPQTTDFLDPFQQRVADRVLHHFKDIKQVVWGGYEAAERARLMVFSAVKQATVNDVPLAFLAANAPAQASGLSHRDWLGALLGLGLRREKVGDIIVTSETSAQVVVHPELLNFLLANWQQIAKYNLELCEITAAELSPTVGRVREIKTTVASLRLDAVASCGFGLSRSKLTPAIRAGHVKLNWQSVKSASAAIKEGDVIAVSGRGRVEVAQVLGQSKKGRIQLLLKKHL
ncbi:MAG TPA: YlmH/Sll1252 family protein [Oscillospiraceae bacterium]|nr:YlmH/Sll1252 family protein [Oscillospiraceae bacterium]